MAVVRGFDSLQQLTRRIGRRANGGTSQFGGRRIQPYSMSFAAAMGVNQDFQNWSAKNAGRSANDFQAVDLTVRSAGQFECVLGASLRKASPIIVRIVASIGLRRKAVRIVGHTKGRRVTACGLPSIATLLKCASTGEYINGQQTAAPTCVIGARRLKGWLLAERRLVLTASGKLFRRPGPWPRRPRPFGLESILGELATVVSAQLAL
jgi:hypothetical protein